MPFPAPSKQQAKILWMSLTALAVAVFLAIIGVVMLGAGWLINRLAPVFLPLAVGAIVAYLLDPIVDWVEAKYRFSRLKAIISVFVVLGIAQLGLVMTVLPDLIVQANDLVESFAQEEDKKPSGTDETPQTGNEVETSTEGKEETFGSSVDDGLDEQANLTETAPTDDADFASVDPDLDEAEKENDSPPGGGEEAGADGQSGEAKPPVDDDSSTGASTLDVGGKKPADADAASNTSTNTLSMSYFDKAKKLFENLLPQETFADENRASVQDLITENGTKILSAVLQKVVQAVGKIASLTGFVIGFAMVPVFVFFFLLEEKRIVANWTKYVPVKSEKWREEIVFVLSSINDSLIVFFRGQVLVGLCLGTLIAIGFSLIGLKYAVLLGIMAAVLSIIPYLGVILSVLPALIIAIVQYQDWLHPLLVLLVFVLVQMAEGLVISPKIIGDRVGMHPLTIIIAVLIGTTLLGGIVGGVLAIPLTAALRAIMFRYVWKTDPKKSRLGRAVKT